MSTQIREISFRGHQIFVGLDVHKNSWQVSIALKEVIQKTFHMSPGSPQELKAYLNRHYPDGTYHCAYESGFCGFWIQEALTRLGITTWVYHAIDIPTSNKEKRQKTDKRDSLKIVKALRQGDCEPIYVPDKDQQKMRSLVRQRASIVKDRQRIMHRIKSHLSYYGIKCEALEWRQEWSGKHMEWLKRQAEGGQDQALDWMLRELALMRNMEKEILQQLRQISKTSTYKSAVDLLLSVPGVGLKSALVILTEIGLDFNRFSKFDRLCAYCGLMPDTKSSGETQRVGDLTHRGNRRLRCILIECAWAAMKGDPELALCYNEYKKRMTGQKAIIKIARKLLNRIRRVLNKKEIYTLVQAQ
ncbi:MAG: IS110 family transposase [Bacteroidetes bacterium]|nr:MAG: IS110 family transposase [Bacteroidota bacterium]